MIDVFLQLKWFIVTNDSFRMYCGKRLRLVCVCVCVRVRVCVCESRSQAHADDKRD